MSLDQDESALLLSVVVATHNRPEQLALTLASLEAQDLARDSYQVIVVDDGSSPPAQVAGFGRVQLVRLEGVERCAARNAGATAATAPLLLFVDDDMRLPRHFLKAHLAAHTEWPGCMVIGAVSLPPQWKDTPFGRFRGANDSGDWPTNPGPGSSAAFCTAQNMSMQRNVFLELGGFDLDLIASEDQDLGLRWLKRGGQIAFCGQAAAEHHDNARDIRSYCSRMEWGSRSQVRFAQKYPELPSSLRRHSVNGPVQWRREPVQRSLQKLIKSLVGQPVPLFLLFSLASLLEKRGSSPSLTRLYHLLMGIHLQRGWRAGL